MIYFSGLVALIGAYCILSLSFRLMIGDAGLFAVSHAAFWALGAYVGALVSLEVVNDFAVEAVLAMGFCWTVGALVGLAALRLRDEYLVIATLGFHLALVQILVNVDDVTGGAAGLTGIPRLSLFGWTFGSDVAFAGLVLAVTAVVAIVLARVTRSRTGLRLRLLHADEAAAEAFGVHGRLTKVVVFASMSAIAGVAGVLYAHYARFIDPFSFSLDQAIILFAMVALGGMLHPLGPVVGAVVIGYLPEGLQELGLPPATSGPIREITYGSILVLMVLFRPAGLLPDRWGTRRVRGEPASGDDPGAAHEPSGPMGPAATADGDVAAAGAVLIPATRDPAGAATLTARSADARPEPKRTPVATAYGDAPAAVPYALEVCGVSKAFGGLRAVHRASLTVRPGECLGILGPNGAGKTTLFNLIGGTLDQDEGRITVFGEPHGGQGHRLARQGVSRCFQDLRLVHDLPAWLNVAVGRREWLPDRDVALRWLDQVGIDAETAVTPVRDLSYGEQKLVSLARALATEPRLLLLDEVAAGVDEETRSRIIAIVRRFVVDGGACLLVEHNVGVVTSVSDRVVFMDAGVTVKELDPSEVHDDEELRSAYLGT